MNRCQQVDVRQLRYLRDNCARFQSAVSFYHRNRVVTCAMDKELTLSIAERAALYLKRTPAE